MLTLERGWGASRLGAPAGLAPRFGESQQKPSKANESQGCSAGYERSDFQRSRGRARSARLGLPHPATCPAPVRAGDRELEPRAQAEGGAGVAVRDLHVGLGVIAARDEAGLALLVEGHG